MYSLIMVKGSTNEIAAVAGLLGEVIAAGTFSLLLQIVSMGDGVHSSRKRAAKSIPGLSPILSTPVYLFFPLFRCVRLSLREPALRSLPFAQQSIPLPSQSCGSRNLTRQKEITLQRRSHATSPLPLPSA